MKALFTLLSILIISTTSLFSQINQTLTFSQNDLVFTQSQGFDRVNMPNTGYLHFDDFAGEPQLPIKNISLLLPQGAKATDVTMTINQDEVLSGNYYLYPLQPPTYSNGEEPPAFVEPNPAIYNSNTPFPQNHLYGYNTKTFRDYTLVSISFCPFIYKPLDRELRLATQINS